MWYSLNGREIHSSISKAVKCQTQLKPWTRKSDYQRFRSSEALWCQFDEQKFVLKLNYSIPLFIWVSVSMIRHRSQIDNFVFRDEQHQQHHFKRVYKKRSRKTGDSSAKAMLPVVFIWIIANQFPLAVTFGFLVVLIDTNLCGDWFNLHANLMHMNIISIIIKSVSIYGI